jgi:hypothetical protein
MAETIKKVDYFVMDVPNKPGEAARALEAIAAWGVNLLAFTGFPSGRRAQLDFIPEDTAAFTAAAKQVKLKVKRKKAGFLVQGDDRPGAVADIMKQLADSKINVTAIDAISAGMGRYGAILWVQPRDVNKAAKALGAS